MRLLSSLQAERLRRYPCKNIAFAQAFLYLSSYPETHLIVRIQLESAPVGDQSSGPVRHEKSGPLEIPRSASFLRACSTILEIERCPRKNNTDCHLAAVVFLAAEPDEAALFFADAVFTVVFDFCAVEVAPFFAAGFSLSRKRSVSRFRGDAVDFFFSVIVPLRMNLYFQAPFCVGRCVFSLLLYGKIMT